MTDNKPIKPGVYTGMSDVEYHGDKSSLSSSGVKLFTRPGGAALFKYQRDNPVDSEAFRFGRAAHAVIVEGREDIPVMPAPGEVFDVDGVEVKMTKGATTKAATAWISQAGHTWVTAAEHAKIVAMRDALNAHAPARDLLAAPGTPEVSVFAEHPSGVIVKARPDYWLADPDDEGRPVLVDYKTTKNAEPDAFTRACIDYGYAQSAAWYRTVLSLAGCGEGARMVFIAQEKTPPYRVGVYELPETVLDIAARLNEEAVNDYALCSVLDKWPGLTAEKTQIDFPTWWYRKHDKEGA